MTHLLEHDYVSEIGGGIQEQLAAENYILTKKIHDLEHEMQRIRNEMVELKETTRRLDINEEEVFMLEPEESLRPLKRQKLSLTLCSDMDWDKCVFCQSYDDRSNLTCLLNNPIAKLKEIPYKSLASKVNMILMKTRNFTLRSGKKVSLLDAGEGVERTLISRKAKWHKRCREDFFSTFDDIYKTLEEETQAQHENFQPADAITMNDFIKKLRSEMSIWSTSFSGEFNEDCEEKSVPQLLLNFVKNILYGSTANYEKCILRPVLTIAQLIFFNFKQGESKGATVRHFKDREPPLPAYIGLSIYRRSRSKKTIEEMHKLGLSISYNRVLEITSQICHMVVQRAEDEGVVCPSNLRLKEFTICALDNIDHNPVSNTVEDSFHGTGISAFQNPSEAAMRTFRTNFKDVSQKNLRRVPYLPESYSVVPE